MGRRIALVGLLACAACEAYPSYRGTTVEAPTAGWAFDAKQNPDGLTPVAGAKVTFCVCKGKVACACDGSPEDKPHLTSAVSVVTDAQGVFDVRQLVGNDIVDGETYVIRATAPGFEPIVYVRGDKPATDPTEPTNASRFLTLRMRRAQ